MSRSLILSAALALALALGAGPAAAHKVIASAYPSGPEIEGEIGFSNGDMAKNATVEVLGPDGTRLASACRHFASSSAHAASNCGPRRLSGSEAEKA